MAKKKAGRKKGGKARRKAERLEGKTAAWLHEILRAGDLDTLEAVFERAADEDELAQTLVHDFVNSSGTDGKSALEYAVRANNLELVNVLLQLEMFELVDSSNAPLMHAAATNGSVPILKLLLEAGASVDSRVGESAQTPLVCACDSSSKDAVCFLIQSGASIAPMKTSAEGLAMLSPSHTSTTRTLLHLAAINGYDAALLALLEHGGSGMVDAITIADFARKTPWDYAIENKCSLGMASFVFHGSSRFTEDKFSDTTWLKITDINGRTAFHHMCALGYRDLALRVVGETDATYINLPDLHWKTALDMSFAAGHASLSTMLLEHNAELGITVQNSEREVAIKKAQKSKSKAAATVATEVPKESKPVELSAPPPRKRRPSVTPAEKRTPTEIRKVPSQNSVVGTAAAPVVEKTDTTTSSSGSLIKELCVAAASGHVTSINMLLSRGVDVNGVNSDGKTAVQNALAARHTAAAALLMQSGAVVPPADTTVTDADGYTVMHWVCEKSYDVAVRRLFSAGVALVSATDRKGRTPLKLAEDANFTLGSAVLIEQGGAVSEVRHDRRDPGKSTVLHHACREGFINAVGALIRAGASVVVGDGRGRTPVDLVLGGGGPCSTLLGAQLLEAGARIGDTKYLQIKDTTDRRSMMHWACARALQKATASLLSSGKANLSDQDGAEQTPLEIALVARNAQGVAQLLAHDDSQRTTMSFNISDFSGATPLHYACSNETLAPSISGLLTRGVNVEATDARGQTPLENAIAASMGKAAIQLLAANARLPKQFLVNTGDSANTTLLQYAATEGSFAVVRRLVEEHAADVNLDPSGMDNSRGRIRPGASRTAPKTSTTTARGTPISRALVSKATATAAYLLQRGAVIEKSAESNINVRDVEGNTILHHMAKSGNDRYVRSITAITSVKLNIKNNAKLIPIDVATRERHFSCAMELVAAASPLTPDCLTATDADDRTLLHTASVSGNAAVVDALLKGGAFPSSSDKSGKTPLDLSVEYRHYDVALCLVVSAGRGRAETYEISDSTGATLLHMAAQRGLVPAVKALVDLGVPLDLTDNNGRTALDLATAGGFTAIASMLRKKGAVVDDVNVPVTKSVLLHASCAEGDIQRVERMLREGADVNMLDDDRASPLHHAADGGEASVVRALLDRGALVGSTDRGGRTPLRRACSADHPEAAAILLQYGAVITQSDLNMQSAIALKILDYACREGLFDAVNALIAGGLTLRSGKAKERDATVRASIGEACANGNTRIVALLLERGAPAPSVDAIRAAVEPSTRMTVLHWAARQGMVHAAEVVLQLVRECEKQSADVDDDLFSSVNSFINQKEERGWTSLRMACPVGTYDGVPIAPCPQIGAMLLQHRAEVGRTVAIDCQDTSGRTMLHYGALEGWHEVVFTLLELNSRSWEVKDGQGLMPGDVAASHSHTQLVCALTHAGAALPTGAESRRDSTGRTVLHWACLAGHADVVQMVIDRNTNLNVKDAQKKLAIEYALENRNVLIGAMLLEAGAELRLSEQHVQISDNRGVTILHAAAQLGFRQAVSQLLAAKAQTDTMDINGATPLDMACEFRRMDVAVMLVEGGAAVLPRHLVVTDEAGATILHNAASKPQHTHALLNILTICVSVNLDRPDNAGNSALMVASACGNGPGIVNLLEVGSTFSEDIISGFRDKHGRSILHYCAIEGSVSATQIALRCTEPLQLGAHDGSSRSPLNWACEKGNLEVALLLIEAGSPLTDEDIKARSHDERTLLHAACAHGSVHLVLKCLNANVSLDATDRSGLSAMDVAVAASGDRLAIVSHLLERGGACERTRPDILWSLVDATTQETLWHAAAAANHLATTRTLLRHHDRSSINARTVSGHTALEISTRNGHVELAAELLAGGAEIGGAQLDAIGRDGTPLLHCVVALELFGVVESLANAGVNLDAEDAQGYTAGGRALARHQIAMTAHLLNLHARAWIPLNHIEEGGPDPFQYCDENGSTMLHIAADRGYVDAIRIIVAAGVSVTQQDNNGNLPLHHALTRRQTRAVVMLISRGSPVDGVELHEVVDQDNQTVLHHACKQGVTTVVELILEQLPKKAGPLLDAVDTANLSALQYALLSRHTNVASLLLEKGASKITASDVNNADGQGRTALHWSAANGSMRAVNSLINCGASLTSIDKSEMAPLDVAMTAGHTLIGALLLSAGAPLGATDLNRMDANGRCVIHHLSSRGDRERVVALIKANANVNAMDNSGRRPLDYVLGQVPGRGNTRIGCDLMAAGAIFGEPSTQSFSFSASSSPNQRSLEEIMGATQGSIGSMDSPRRTNARRTLTPKHIFGAEFLSEKRLQRERTTIGQKLSDIYSPKKDKMDISNESLPRPGPKDPVRVNILEPNALTPPLPVRSAARHGSDSDSSHSAEHLEPPHRRHRRSGSMDSSQSGDGLRSRRPPAAQHRRTGSHGASSMHGSRSSLHGSRGQSLHGSRPGSLHGSRPASTPGSRSESGSSSRSHRSDTVPYQFSKAFVHHLNVKDKEGRGILHHAVTDNNVPLVKKLILTHVSIDMNDTHSKTPLDLAVQAGNAFLTARLFQAGATAKADSALIRDGGGLTVLHHLVLMRDVASVIRFVSVTRCPIDIPDRQNRSALTYLLSERPKESPAMNTRILSGPVAAPTRSIANQRHAAGQSRVSDEHSSAGRRVSSGDRFGIPKKEGSSPDFSALRSVITRSITGVGTRLEKASRSSSSLSADKRVVDSRMAACLIELGAEIRVTKNDLAAVNNVGATILHYICAAGRLQSFMKLIGHAVPLNVKDKKGRTPLHLALKERHVTMAAFLLENGAEGDLTLHCDLADRSGSSLLHQASSNNLLLAVGRILEAGAFVDPVDDHNRTPLFYQHTNDNRDIALLLLGHGARVRDGFDLERVDNVGRTLLHRAALENNVVAGRRMLEGGAKHDARDVNGKRPLDYALERGFVEVARELLSCYEVLELENEDENYFNSLWGALAGNDTVTSLKLNGGNISLASLTVMCSTLTRNETLRNLQLHRIQHFPLEEIPNKDIKELAGLGFFGSTLKTLNFKDCGLKSTLVELLGSWLGSCKLEMLHLTNCGLKSRDAKDLSDGIMANTSLLNMTLTANNFSNLDAVRSLRAALQRHRNLHVLSEDVIFGVADRSRLIRGYAVYGIFGIVYMLAGIILSLLGVHRKIDFGVALSTPWGEHGEGRRPSIVVVAASLFLFTILFPFLFPFAIMSETRSIVTANVSIAFFLVLPFTWMLAVFYMAYRDINQTFITVDKPSTHVSLNGRNVLACAFLLWEFIQLISLSFVKEAYHRNSSFTAVFEPFLFLFNGQAFLASFWIAFIIAFVWWIVAVYLAVNVLHKNVAGALSSLKYLEEVAKFLSNTLFLVVTTNFLRTISCTNYATSDNPMAVPVLASYVEMPCWTGSHGLYATLGMLGFNFFVTSASFIGINFIEDHSGLSNIQFIEIYTLGERITKLLITVVRLFANQSLSALVVMMVCEICLMSVTYRIQPCHHVRWVNRAKVTSYALAAWSCLCSVVGLAENKSDSYTSVILLVVGWLAVIPVCWVVALIWERRRGAKVQYMESPLPSTVPHTIEPHHSEVVVLHSQSEPAFPSHSS